VCDLVAQRIVATDACISWRGPEGDWQSAPRDTDSNGNGQFTFKVPLKS
jgi:hypothetical protein